MSGENWIIGLLCLGALAVGLAAIPDRRAARAEASPALRVDVVPTMAGEPMKVIHDDANGVTCWWLGSGLSCLPNGSFGGAR